MKNVLTRKLGLWSCVAITVGTVIGSGILVSMANVASVSGSSLLGIIAWVCGGLIIIPQALIVSELATAYPEDGAGYIYLKEAGFGPMSFLYGWAIFWALDPPSISILSLALVASMAVFVPALTGLTAKFVAVAIVIIITAIHYRSVKAGGVFQVIITIAKVLPIIIMIGAALWYLNPENIITSAPARDVNLGLIGCLLAGVSATTWAYTGINSACNMTGEFKDPGKTMPKALIGSAIFITIINTLIAVSLAGLMPFEALVNLNDSATSIPGASGTAIAFISAASAVLILGSLSACIMVQPRLEYAMAKDNMFFKFFAHVHPKYETPDISIIIQSSYGILLIFAFSLTDLLGCFTLIYQVINILLYLSIIFCRRKPDYNPAFRCPAVKVMVPIALIIACAVAWGTFQWAPIESIIGAAVVIATGLPVYYFWKKQKKTLSTESADE